MMLKSPVTMWPEEPYLNVEVLQEQSGGLALFLIVDVPQYLL